MTGWSVHVDRASEAKTLAGDSTRDRRSFVIEDSLGYLLNRAARLMAHELADRLRPAGVGIGQWAVLLFLWARDGATQAELARIVAIEPPTIARTIDRMARDGLVKRSPDPSDGRITRIHLTTRGRALRDNLIPEAIAVNEGVSARLTVTELRTLRRLLAKLVAGPTAGSAR